MLAYKDPGRPESPWKTRHALAKAASVAAATIFSPLNAVNLHPVIWKFQVEF